MRKALILALLILLSTSQNVYAAKVIPGSSCKKLNNQEVYRGKIYTCIKLGKKWYWSNGVKYTTKTSSPTPIQTPTPIPTPIAIPKPSPSPTNLKPGTMTNLSALWEELSDGPSLKITFDFDFSLSSNVNVSSFQYRLTSGQLKSSIIVGRVLNKTSLSQVLNFKYTENLYNFGTFKSAFSLIEISAGDSYGNFGEWTTLANIPIYTPDLCVPIINVQSIVNGYSVADASGCTKSFDFFAIEEVSSNAATAPSSGWQQVYLDKSLPVRVFSSTTETKWVRARYANKFGVYGNYSIPVRVTPLPLISVDLTPPNEVSNASGSWIGENLLILFTLPPSDAGIRFWIILTAPNGSSGTFSAIPTGSSANQTVSLSKADVRAQFGFLSTTYTGVLRSADAAGNISRGVSFVVG